MVICKFFLQGTCKFGDFCKFEHQLNDFSSYQNSTSILRQSQFGNAPPQQPKPATNPSNVDITTLVKSVVNDMTVSEKGGQWLLSCYAPFKEKPCFPGFEDHGFEEIRLGYYEALKNGTVEQYKQQVQMMLQQAVMRLKSLQSPSPDIVNVLKCIYNTPPASHSGVYGTNTATTTTAFGNAANASVSFNQAQTTPFAQQQTPSVFVQPNQNLFGKPAQPQNQFGGASSGIFGGSPQNQVFNTQTNAPMYGTNQNASDNIFRQANTSFAPQAGGSIFGGQPATTQIAAAQPASGSIFGGGQSSPGSVFGAQTNTSVFRGQQCVSPTQPQASGNVFANAFPSQSPFGQNIFGAPPNAQTFAAAQQNVPQQAPPNVFGMGAAANQPQNAQNPAFAQQQPPMFTQQNVGTVFSQQQPNNSPFANVTDANSHSTSIFGGGQNTVVHNTPFGQVQQVDETVYSKAEELTEEEVKWFNSDDLDVLNIPEKPPTYQMCFKT